MAPAAAGSLGSVARASLDCPGSWLPVSHLKIGDVIACPLCGRRVGLTVPPMPEHDPSVPGVTRVRRRGSR